MAPRNPDFVRRELLAHFDNPPRLTFSPPGFTRLDYRQPELDRSADARSAFDNDRPAVQRNAALGQLHAIVRASMERLDYATTTREEWETYVRFAHDRVVHSGRRYALREGKPLATREFINDTREDAQSWFLDELLPIVQEEPGAHVYVLGEPGAGKSTLLKYLINTNAEHLREAGTVFSRFEFQKFCDRFYSGSLSHLRTDLYNYIAFLLLRDLIWSAGYGFDARGKRVRLWLLPALRDIAQRAFDRHGLDSTRQVDRAARQLDTALKTHEIDFTALKLIDPWVMAVLVDYLRQDRKIALVLDGLDCVAVEDSAFDAERYQLLKKIFALRPQLTNLVVPVVDTPDDEDLIVAAIRVQVPASLIFVIRENTFFMHGDGLRREVPLVNRHMFRVGNIDPEVALLNVLRRGGVIWSKKAGETAAAGEAYAQRLMHGFHTAFRHLNGALHTGKPCKMLLGIFCGNLRHLFHFLERLIAWLIEDAITERLLLVGPATDLNAVLAFVASPDGQEVLRRRSYRLIEILLFYRLPWFETLVQTGYGDMDSEFMPDAEAARLKDNSLFTGFLDNIFNYHIHDHDLKDDLHPLLEKIRIIQLLRGQSLSLPKLKAALNGRLGYSSPSLVKALHILVRGQLVRVHVTKNELLFMATARGEILLDHVARSMTYLEHVYHQTLFPAEFLPTRPDAPRGRRVENWTAQSIRNCFVFLAYMRFVEANRANGKPVQETLRIYRQTFDQVRRSIVGIVGDPDEPPQDHHLDIRQDTAAREARQLALAREERQIAIAGEALGLVENTLSHWDRLGYIARPGHK